MEHTKLWNLSSIQCPIDGVGETIKPQNHKSMKPIVITMTQRCSEQNHETYHHFKVQEMKWVKTMKPLNLLASRCPEVEWTKPWNLSSFRCPGYGVHKTTKPIGFSLSRDGTDESMKPWNYEIMKPIGFSLSSDGVEETMKPRNHKTYHHFDDPEMEWDHETKKPWSYETYHHLDV